MVNESSEIWVEVSEYVFLETVIRKEEVVACQSVLVLEAVGGLILLLFLFDFFAGTNDIEISLLGFLVNLVFTNLEEFRAEGLQETIFKVLFNLRVLGILLVLCLKLSELRKVSRLDNRQNFVTMSLQILRTDCLHHS
jgi:uncharacterized membrane protein